MLLILVLAAAAALILYFLMPDMLRYHNDTAGMYAGAGEEIAAEAAAEAAAGEPDRPLSLDALKPEHFLNLLPGRGPRAGVYVREGFVSSYALQAEAAAAEEARLAAEEQARLAAEEEERARLHAEPFTIAFAGDILFDPSYAVGQYVTQAGGLAPCLDEQAREIMTSADIMVINNEFPYTDGGAPLEGKTYTFHAPTYTAAWLTDAGVDLAALANNHIFDYGEQGFLDTLSTLENQGIPYYGAGRNIEEASKAVYYTFGQMTVAMLNATQIERYANSETRAADAERGGVFKCLDPSLLYQRVREAKENADYVIVFIHWGTEKENYPDSLQKEQAAGLAAAGADLVVGAHPHRIQGVEYYGETPVAYSIGNFFFSSYPLDVSILEVTLDPDTQSMISLRMVPMQQSGNRVRTLDGAEKERFISDLRSFSTGVTIDGDGYISR